MTEAADSDTHRPRPAERRTGGSTAGFAWEVFRRPSGARSICHTLATNVLILAVTAGTGIILARALGPEGRGQLAAITLWPGLLAYLLTLGLPSALVFNLKRHPDEASQLVGSAFLLGPLIGAAGAFAGVIVLPFFLGGYETEAIHFAQWAMLITPVVLTCEPLNAVLRAHDRFALWNWLRLLGFILILVGVVGLAVAGRLTPFTAALVSLLAGVPGACWSLRRVWVLSRPSFRALGKSRQHLLGYGFRSYGAELFNTLSIHTDRVLLVALLSPELLGIYVVARSLAEPLQSLQKAVTSVLFPKASAMGMAEAVAVVGLLARVNGALTSGIAVAVAAVAPFAVPLLYGVEFSAAVPVLQILLVEGVLRGMMWVLAQAFPALGRPMVVTLLQGLGLAVSIPLLLLLGPIFGPEGAALALMISAAVRVVFVCGRFWFVLDAPAPALLPRRQDASALLGMIGGRAGSSTSTACAARP